MKSFETKINNDNKSQAVANSFVQKKDSRSPGMSHRETLPGGIVQRRIQDGTGTDLPGTWLAAKKKYPGQPVSTEMDNVILKVQGKLGPNYDDELVKTVWGRVAKHKVKIFDLINDQDKLVDEIEKGVNSSQKCAGDFAKRKRDAETLGSKLGADFEFKTSARNPKMQKTALDTFDYNPAMPKQKQAQRHIATVVLDRFGGTEAQASLRNDKQDLFIATNEGAVNERLRQDITSPDDLREQARETLRTRNADTMDVDTAMEDRPVRHAAKLIHRLNNYLVADGAIVVPPKIQKQLEGRHAEIRIQQTVGWGEATHCVPAGTKYPCMGCTLYFNSEGIDVGAEMGAMWVTDAALSTQLEGELKAKRKIGSLSDPDKVAQKIVDQFKKIDGKVAMGMGKRRSGGADFDCDADSDSDMDEDDYKSVLSEL